MTSLRGKSKIWYLFPCIVIFALSLSAGFLASCSENDDNNDSPAELETWVKLFGGSLEDRGKSVSQVDDGGYIACGYTQSFGAGMRDLYVVRTDSHGELIWELAIGGSNSDHGRYAEQTPDGGFIVSGGLKPEGFGSSDVLVAKLSASGAEEWRHTYGGSGWDSGMARSIAGGGYIVVGETTSFGGGYDMYMLRLDDQGNELWSRHFGGSGDDYGQWVTLTSDGGFLFCGSTSSTESGAKDALLVKLDANGEVLWSQAYGGSDEETGRQCQILTDGSIILVGGTRSSGAGGRDIYLVHCDATGNVLWSKTFGGSEDESGRSVVVTDDGGFGIAGATESEEESESVAQDMAFRAGQNNPADRILYLIKTDGQGNQQWTKSYHGGDKGYSMIRTSDGGYALCGATGPADDPTSDFFIAKTDGVGFVEGFE